MYEVDAVLSIKYKLHKNAVFHVNWTYLNSEVQPGGGGAEVLNW